MSKSEVEAIMKNSKNEAEWNKNCDYVKKQCGGYPDFWFTTIITSGLMAKVQLSW